MYNSLSFLMTSLKKIHIFVVSLLPGEESFRLRPYKTRNQFDLDLYYGRSTGKGLGDG